MSIRSLFTLLAFAFGVASPVGAHHVAKVGTPRTPSADAPLVNVAGYADAITIDNRVDGTVRRLAVLVTEAGERLLLTNVPAASITVGASYALAGRASGAAFFADTLTMTAVSDARYARANINSPMSISGTLRLGHADRFDGEPSEFFYAIVSEAEQYRISLATLIEGLENGMPAIVSGRVAADGSMFADSILILGGGVKPNRPEFSADGSHSRPATS